MVRHFAYRTGGRPIATNTPGKAHREDITLMQLAEMFPDEDSAREWFESRVWPDGRRCPRCGSTRTREASRPTMPYWCSDCRSYFSIKVGTVLENSLVPLRKWTRRTSAASAGTCPRRRARSLRAAGRST